MSEPTDSTERVARQVRRALQAADLAGFSDLLDPKVRWGPPGDHSPPCKNRQQVLAWYQRGKESGATAQVSEVTVLADRILVGLIVTGTRAARERGGNATRWQVLTVRDGLVVEIVGFDQRMEAVSFAEVGAA